MRYDQMSLFSNRFEFYKKRLQLDLTNSSCCLARTDPCQCSFTSLLEFAAHFRNLNLKNINYAWSDIPIIELFEICVSADCPFLSAPAHSRFFPSLDCCGLMWLFPLHGPSLRDDPAPGVSGRYQQDLDLSIVVVAKAQDPILLRKCSGEQLLQLGCKLFEKRQRVLGGGILTFLFRCHSNWIIEAVPLLNSPSVRGWGHGKAAHQRLPQRTLIRPSGKHFQDGTH